MAEKRTKPEKEKKSDNEAKTSFESSSGEPAWKTNLIVVAFSVFLFLYVGMEYCFGTYLTEFAVESKELDLTRKDGAHLTALFWGAFSLMRFLAIFAAFHVPPAAVLGVSFAICVAAASALLVWAETSLMSLQVRLDMHVVMGVFLFVRLGTRTVYLQ